MMRPVEEIVRSQAKMVDRLGTGGERPASEEMAAVLQKHRDQVLTELRSQPATYEVLEVDYPALIADPAGWAARVAEFVGPERLPHPERMAGAVRTDLHRNRASS